MSLESCYYGDRKVIYVQIRLPDHQNGNKMMSVYGHTLEEVLRAVDQGLEKAFGKVDAKRPAGRQKKWTGDQKRLRSKMNFEKQLKQIKENRKTRVR